MFTRFIRKKSGAGHDTAWTATLREERRAMLRYAVYRLGNAADAEDAVQDVCLKLWSRQQTEQPAPAPVSLRGYLYRSLANLCTDRLRKKTGLPDVPLAEIPAPEDGPDENFEQELRRITALLRAIPDEQAEVIRLRIYGEQSFAEIAEILGVPVTTVKSRFQYGIGKIRRQLSAGAR